MKNILFDDIYDKIISMKINLQRNRLSLSEDILHGKYFVSIIKMKLIKFL